MTVRLVWMVVAFAVLLSTLLSGSAAAQPPVPDPEVDFPSSTEDMDDIDIEFIPFPEGADFEYGGVFFGIWQENCELLQDLENETDEWVTWQSFLEADPNYDCGDNYRSNGANANSGATGVGGYGSNGFSADVYECGVDAGAWNHADRKIFAFACSSIFGLNKMFVSWSIAVIEWAFRFDVGNAMAPYTSSVGDGYFAGLGGGGVNSAYWAALAFTTFYMAVKVLRGQMSKGVGELGMSVVLLLAFWAMVINGSGFGGLTTGALNTTGVVSAEIGRLTLDQSSTGDCPGPVNITIPPWFPGVIQDRIDDHNARYGGTGQLVCPMANGVFITLVENPHEIINWGSDLEGVCSEVNTAVLASGPWGNDDTPRHMMAQANCQAEADYNHDPSDARVGMAFVTMLVSIMTLILIVGMALVLLCAQIVLALTIMVMPFAMISAALPGTGRNLFFKWMTVFIKVAILVIFMTGLLALHLSTLNVAMRATEDSPWAAQAAVMILVTVLMFALMKKAVTHSGSAAARATTAIAGAVTPNGSAGTTAGLATAGQFGQRSLNTIATTTKVLGNTTAVAGVIAGGAVVGGTSQLVGLGGGSLAPTGTAAAGAAVSGATAAGIGAAGIGARSVASQVVPAAVFNRAAGGAARRALDRTPVPA